MIVLHRVEIINHDALIADHAAVAIGGTRVHPSRVHTRLVARDEEGAGRCIAYRLSKSR